MDVQLFCFSEFNEFNYHLLATLCHSIVIMKKKIFTVII